MDPSANNFYLLGLGLVRFELENSNSNLTYEALNQYARQNLTYKQELLIFMQAYWLNASWV